MDTTPNSPYDVLAQDVSKMKQDVASLVKRSKSIELTILQILKTFKVGEEAFELRVARVLHNVMSGITHELEHSISETAKSIAQLERGFDIFPVDGHTVKENDRTILVTRTETGYNFALASDPETLHNEGTEHFAEWFQQNPEVMGDRKELLVNIIAYTTAKADPDAPVLAPGEVGEA